MKDIVKFASKYVGVKQGSPTHKSIINSYNKIVPLPRSYKVKYNDNWCAAFVSFVLHSCGCSLNLYECSAERMHQKFIKNNLIIKSTDGQPGDIIFYDWNDNNWCDHVGIISESTKKQYKVIEGNNAKAVGIRTISKTSKNIAAVGRIAKTLSESDILTMAKDVIKGKYGSGQARKNALGQYYDLVQKKVNELLK